MADKSKSISIIDRGLRIDGTVSSTGRLIIKGNVKGTLEGETVIIAQEGVVGADITVASMTVGGTFKGEIRASQELIILSTGNCSGKIVCKDLIVEAGGMLNAEITCTTAKEQVDSKSIAMLSKK